MNSLSHLFYEKLITVSDKISVEMISSSFLKEILIILCLLKEEKEILVFLKIFYSKSCLKTFLKFLWHFHN